MADDLQGDDRDINDAFDSVVMLEQKVAADGYREGFEKGQQDGTEEGYRLGHRHGMNFGTELGFYRGAASTWIESSSKLDLPDKGVEAMKTVIQLLDTFPTVVSENMDVNDECNKVRAAYRKACALLKVEPVFPVTTTLSF